jgi:hypothetical protein
LLNSSIERFIQTFALLNEFLGKGEQLPLHAKALVRDIDPEAYPASEWRLLVDHLNAAEPGEGDALTDELLASDPRFQALVAKSKAGPRKPFPPAE